MTEDFLHFVWRFRLGGLDLLTTDGDTVELIRPGEHNRDAGPDFVNSRLRIGDTLWVGNVEVHLRSSDWIRHGHQHDPAYDNVILHVVMEHDATIRRKNGEAIPVLELGAWLDGSAYATYQGFLGNHLWVPCALRLGEIREITIQQWLSVLSVSRLERKSNDIKRLLEYYHYDWNQAFYESLASTLGFRVNKAPFELLARQTPLHFIEKHKDNLLQVEAMLFGQAGLLEGRFRGGYPAELQREYLHLKRKFSLEPVAGHLWKFLRLRPNNFPTIRIAQLSMILHQRINIFGDVLDNLHNGDLAGIFQAGVSDYWKSHYRFGSNASRVMNKTISSETIGLVMINNVIPFLFLYGQQKDNPFYRDRALNMLADLSPESNSITRKFAEFGIVAENACQSQGLMEMKLSFCDERKCLDCRIGLELIR